MHSALTRSAGARKLAHQRVIDPRKLDDVLITLDSRRASTTLPSAEPSSCSSSSAGPAPTSASASAAASSAYSSLALDPFKIKKRMEEDRERRWVQPVSHNAPVGGAPPLALASFLPLTDEGDGVGELTLDIEFENEWETMSDWNEDDDEAEENVLCFPPYGEYGEGDWEAMDLS